MHLKPFNKHLLIQPREQEQTIEKQIFVMPDEYQPPKSPYVIADVIDMSDDCSIDLSLGDTVVVERTTVQEIKSDAETIYVVKENYVYGRLDSENQISRGDCK
jgi:co-chaperonin GroES (HSP10)